MISLLNSCKNKETHQLTNKNTIKTPQKILIESGDTIVVKQQNKIEDYDKNTLKSLSYLWITHLDTLDFKIHVSEYLIDDNKKHIHINIDHSKTMYFSTALEKLKKSISIIQEDLDLENLGSIQFAGTYRYKDFETTLPKEYKKKYGLKKINQKELNNFLLESSIDIELKKVLILLNKDAYEYWIEKFQVKHSKITGIAILIKNIRKNLR